MKIVITRTDDGAKVVFHNGQVSAGLGTLTINDFSNLKGLARKARKKAAKSGLIPFAMDIECEFVGFGNAVSG